MRIVMILCVLAAAGAAPSTRPTTQPANARETRKQIAAAIHEHRIIVGMTIAEANDAMDHRGVKFSEDGWAWPVFAHGDQTGTIAAIVANKHVLAVESFNGEREKGELVTWEADKKRPPAKPTPIQLAIRDHNLCRGMSLAEAEKAMGGPGIKVQETDSSETYEWGIFAHVEIHYTDLAPRQTGAWYAVFVNGKVVQVDRDFY